MTQEFTDAQYALIMKLMNKTEDIQVFEYEGVLYQEYKVDVIKNFVKNNPTGGDFHVWLQQHYSQSVLTTRSDLNDILSRLEA